MFKRLMLASVLFLAYGITISAQDIVVISVPYSGIAYGSLYSSSPVYLQSSWGYVGSPLVSYSAAPGHGLYGVYGGLPLGLRLPVSGIGPYGVYRERSVYRMRGRMWGW